MTAPLIVGNWKMHTTSAEASALASSIVQQSSAAMQDGVGIVLCPPFLAIPAVRAALNGTSIGLGAQDCHHMSHGAYTGDVSAPMLADAGCTHVIVGHSERRRYHGETDHLIAQKVTAAIMAGLTPIVCIGETQGEREAGTTMDVVDRQLTTVIDEAGADAVRRSVIAYEPVWAIGTGLAATPEQAQEVHAAIRAICITKECVVPILYGGSVNDANAATLFACADIDGALVGGASLQAASFVRIIEAAARS
jgi:triosephosphate isomerase